MVGTCHHSESGSSYVPKNVFSAGAENLVPQWCFNVYWMENSVKMSPK